MSISALGNLRPNPFKSLPMNLSCSSSGWINCSMPLLFIALCWIKMTSFCGVLIWKSKTSRGLGLYTTLHYPVLIDACCRLWFLDGSSGLILLKAVSTVTLLCIFLMSKDVNMCTYFRLPHNVGQSFLSKSQFLIGQIIVDMWKSCKDSRMNSGIIHT